MVNEPTSSTGSLEPPSDLPPANNPTRPANRTVPLPQLKEPSNPHSEYLPSLNSPTHPDPRVVHLPQVQPPSNPPSDHPLSTNTPIHPATHTDSLYIRVFTRNLKKLEREAVLGRNILKLDKNKQYKGNKLGRLLHSVALAHCTTSASELKNLMVELSADFISITSKDINDKQLALMTDNGEDNEKLASFFKLMACYVSEKYGVKVI